MAKKTFTAEELVRRIRRRYEGQAHVVLEQVNRGTGYGGSWIDAAVIGMWPSKGLTRSAFEVKVSRGDFIAELKQPQKNAWARQYFHEFWFVAPAGVIKEDELPDGCGWMKPRGDDQLVIVRHASRRDGAVIDDMFVASLCRSALNEIQRHKKSVSDDVMDACRDYQQAKTWREAAGRFLTERGIRYPDVVLTEENDLGANLAAAFVQAMGDAQQKEEREAVLSKLDEFTRTMHRLFEAFVCIAHVAMTERNEVGRLIVERWGSEDASGLAMSRARARKPLRKGSRSERDAARKLVDFYEFLTAFVSAPKADTVPAFPCAGGLH